ncbi:hypothetical protein TrST_g8475 [Triparma strigata]|uniref:Lipocalin/cytosolic fatty-acid binding domain-containing protein n=1 Tax=Triparma strigata TaxID=1606541 RepID=A0A9W7F099_9STRA|nr:hypothetical protein TrST_g8475 [Triparma strigata]
MLRLLLLLGLGFAGNVQAATLSCPSYEDIVNVSMLNFNVQHFSSTWYMIATNEPTLPSNCTCSINNVTVSPDSKTYSYTNLDSCFDTMDIAIHIAGEISDPFGEPGYLMENAVVAGHQLTPLKPNYLFAVDRDEDGNEAVVYSYACLGKILGKERFSFNVLSKSKDYDEADIQKLIDEVVAKVDVELDTDGIRFSTKDDYEHCEQKENNP